MTLVTNNLGQPVGAPVPGWTPRERPSRQPMPGRFCRLEPLSASMHAKPLHEVFRRDPDARHWTYLPYGPFASAEEYTETMRSLQSEANTTFYTILDEPDQRPIGVAAYLRIDQAMGSIEVGHLRFSSLLQRRPAATEAMYLMMKRVFDELGYRRYEWKCDSANAPSLAAARRLGFRFEGTFRQHMVLKGRSRDTSWLSILDSEWPALRRAFEQWLDPSNFDASGAQKRRLGDFAQAARESDTARARP